MDEKRRILKVLERTEEELEKKLEITVEEIVAPKSSRQNLGRGQTSPLEKPILKNLAKFANVKIGDKLSVKDLIR